MPVTTANICRYAAHLSFRLKVSSIPKYLGIIRTLHMEAGLPNPLEQNYFLNSLLTGIRRVQGTETCRKLPITTEVLLGFRGCLDLSVFADVLFWAACLIAFHGLLRKSNLFPSSSSLFDSKKHLTVADVYKSPHGLALRIKWSKTIQFQQRTYLIPMPLLHGHALCPATAITQLLLLQPRSAPTTPLLCWPTELPMTQGQFTTRLQTVSQNLG